MIYTLWHHTHSDTNTFLFESINILFFKVFFKKFKINKSYRETLEKNT